MKPIVIGQIDPLTEQLVETCSDLRGGPIKMALSTPPTGQDISQKAAAGEFDTANSVTGVTHGKKVIFTPAHLGHVGSMQDLEQGQIIGSLNTEIAGDKSGLPAGQYNVFLAKVGNDWQVFAESGSTVVAKAASVVERRDTRANMKPQFSEGSFCWWVWLIVTGFQWCF